MANEQRAVDKKKEEYVEGIVKTVIPVLCGIIAGVISFFVVTDPLSSDGLLIAILLVMVQKFIYPFFHMNLEGAKDWLYISFMTGFCWFVTFALMLNV
jgi:membrane protein YdbS with pleckstrin-like domain